MCPNLPFLPFVLILSLAAFFDGDLKLNYAFKSISRLLQAHRTPCILHWFYKTPPHVTCVHRTARASSGIRLGATWRSLLMIPLTFAFYCVVCSPIASLTLPVPVLETWVDSQPPPSAELTCLWVWDNPPPWPIAWLCWPSSAAPSFDAFALPQWHTVCPHL